MVLLFLNTIATLIGTPTDNTCSLHAFTRESYYLVISYKTLEGLSIQKEVFLSLLSFYHNHFTLSKVLGLSLCP